MGSSSWIELGAEACLKINSCLSEFLSEMHLWYGELSFVIKLQQSKYFLAGVLNSCQKHRSIVRSSPQIATAENQSEKMCLL
jgi:hypothetical protein